jgi:hypothetical protein
MGIKNRLRYLGRRLAGRFLRRKGKPQLIAWELDQAEAAELLRELIEEQREVIESLNEALRGKN